MSDKFELWGSKIGNPKDWKYEIIFVSFVGRFSHFKVVEITLDCYVSVKGPIR